MKTGLLLAAAAAAALSTSAASAQVLLDFSTDQYSTNFVETLNGGSIGHNAGLERVDSNMDNLATVVRYDTNPGNAQFDDANFLTQTISIDTLFSSVTLGSSAAIIARVQTGTNLGVMAIANMQSTTSAQLRLFFNAQITGSAAGTSFYDATFNLATGAIVNTTGSGGTGSTNSIAINTPITLTLTQTSAADPVFSFTLSDAEGTIATSGNQTLTSTNAYDGAGGIALRFADQINNGATSVSFDNFTIVPEPGSALLALGGGVALLLRRRRRA